MENQYTDRAHAVVAEIEKVIIGKRVCIEKVICAMLAGGHILMEDIPGVGKTTLAIALSRALSLKYNRIQFTPDVLPSDLNGFQIYHKEQGEFLYHPGPILCNLFLADEINRTSPKTQAALLEVMEEGTVTVDSVSRPVPEPFMVIATQNPAGSAGTQLLPESQMDRFMLCLSMGYPTPEEEILIVKRKRDRNMMEQVEAVATEADICAMKELVEQTYVHDKIYQYIARLVQATREHPMIALGVSPRGTIALVKTASAMAFMRGRDYVVPDDVAAVYADVVEHRLVPGAKARAAALTARKLAEQVFESVPRPAAKKQ